MSVEFPDLVKVKEKHYRNVFENKMASFQLLLTKIMDNKLSVKIL